MSCIAVLVWPWTLNAGTEHVGCSTKNALLAPNAKRPEALGESHEG